jgi:signal transduction histidine kinase
MFEEPPSEEAGAMPAGPDGRATVLVVEDQPAMNRFIAESLAAEFQVVAARDGQEGLAKALALRPDLIVSDVMMPGMGGDRLLAEIRGHPELEALPFILLTAKADDALRIRLLREGAQDYLMKPFSVEELRVRVANQVSMQRTRRLLQQELESQSRDLEQLAAAVTFRKRELEQALEATQIARDMAERAGQARADFLRLVSHELRSPLTVLDLQLQLLQRGHGGELTERQQAIVRRMSGAGARLLELIESLLEHARIESGRLVTHVAAFDLNDLAAKTIEELRPQADQKRLELTQAPAPDLPWLRSDARLVRLILVNLLSNAVKYTEQGRVEVRLWHADGAHRLTVQDTGPGIAPDRLEIIFEPFAQLEAVRQKHTPGVGLGLSLVRRMVEALGGQIQLQSDMGRGSAFTVTLPPADAGGRVLAAEGRPRSEPDGQLLGDR